MDTLVLVINCGSSSLKFAVFDADAQQVVLTGLAEKLGHDDACLHLVHDGVKDLLTIPNADHRAAMQSVVAHLHATGLAASIVAIGHRVVHGGEVFKTSVRIDDAVLAQIEQCVPLAPLHNPANLLGIRHAQEALPHVPQVAVFDTAFHQSMPEHAFLYAVPYDLYTTQAVRRYGFHGTSYRFVVREAARMLQKLPADVSLVCAHLGNGASVAAVRHGQSVDTSMGLTPLEGLVMGTRSGDVDPGLFDFLAQRLDMDIAQITELLNKQSGLLGLSALSSDCRELEQAMAQGHAGARRALEKFCYQLAKHIAGQWIAAGQVDALVFTGGIGENSAWVRARTIAWLQPLGVMLDAERNFACTAGRGGWIHAEDSVPVLVVHTNEEMMIALDTAELVFAQDSSGD